MTSATENLPGGPFFAERVDIEAARAAYELEFPCHCDAAFLDRGLHSSDCVFDEWEVVVPILEAALVGVKPALMEGWCPRGGGHTDGPDQEGDYGVCGSKWAKVRLVTDWGEIR